MSPNDADGMANSVDPDQTAPLGAVWSGSALFAQAYLSENLGSLQYIKMAKIAQNSKILHRASKEACKFWVLSYFLYVNFEFWTIFGHFDALDRMSMSCGISKFLYHSEFHFSL